MNDIMTPEVAFEDSMMGALGVFVVVYMLFLLLAMAFAIAAYVLGSLGLYTVAQRRGIRRSWLAWVPLGNMWILGSLSDQYQYIARGKVKNRRKIILTLGIILFAIYFLWLFATIICAVAGGEIGAALVMLFGLLVIAVVAIWLAVCEYMAYYDLFKSCEPDNAVLYLVLSILFSVSLPFFVFACRKKDLGMPPRKQPAPQQVVVPAVEPVVDPTVVEKVVIPTVEPVVDPDVVEKVVIPTVEPVTEEGFAQPEEFEEIE